MQKLPPKMSKQNQSIAHRLREAGVRFFANDNIAPHLSPEDRQAILKDVEAACDTLLRALVIDIDSDHNTKDTAARLAKMYVNEVFSGRYDPPPKVTDFPNVSNLDQIYAVGPIRIRSMCSHHFMPIVGKVWVGIFPGDSVMGLSKFSRIADWIMSRPSIQEESTTQIADMVESVIQPQGVGVVVKAKHHCCISRGVKDDGMWMTTSVVRGSLRTNSDLKNEFFKLVEQSRD